MTLLDHLRDHLVAEAIVRRPDQAGAGARPWLPPAWKHPDDGAPGPGDREDAGAAATSWDDGLVVSLFHAPGTTSEPGNEDRRRFGIDVVYRGNAVPAISSIEAEVRAAILGDPAQPGGQTDWTMAGLYIIQSIEWSPFQPLEATTGTFTFKTGYLFETWVA